MRPFILAAALATALGATGNSAWAEVKVGMITTLSGGGAGLGIDVRDGFMLAVQQSGRDDIEVLIEDDQRKPAIAVQLADRMIPAEDVDVMAQLITIIADKTGYPEDAQDPDQNLEADLGIDSIKRMEILGELRKQLPAAAAEDEEDDEGDDWDSATYSGSRTSPASAATCSSSGHCAKYPRRPPALLLLSAEGNSCSCRKRSKRCSCCVHSGFR